jgi:hypothetical protein
MWYTAKNCGHDHHHQIKRERDGHHGTAPSHKNMVDDNVLLNLGIGL